MGLLIPIYPYYSAKGTDDNRKSKGGAYNGLNKSMFQPLFYLLNQPLVREVGIKCRAVYPRKEHADLRKIRWRAPETYETETMQRLGLDALMSKLRNRGTIVVPSHKHLTADSEDAKKVLERLCNGALAPIAIDRLQKTMQPLIWTFSNQGDRLPSDIKERIEKFFGALTSDAVRVRGTVENSRVRKGFN